MIRIYIITTVVVMCFCAYFSGYYIGRTNANIKCNINTTKQVIQTIKQTEQINAKVYHTNVRDIRRILRAQYTIAK